MARQNNISNNKEEEKLDWTKELKTTKDEKSDRKGVHRGRIGRKKGKSTIQMGAEVAQWLSN